MFYVLIVKGNKRERERDMQKYNPLKMREYFEGNMDRERER